MKLQQGLYMNKTNQLADWLLETGKWGGFWLAGIETDDSVFGYYYVIFMFC